MSTDPNVAQVDLGTDDRAVFACINTRGEVSVNGYRWKDQTANIEFANDELFGERYMQSASFADKALALINYLEQQNKPNTEGSK